MSEVPLYRQPSRYPRISGDNVTFFDTNGSNSGSKVIPQAFRVGTSAVTFDLSTEHSYPVRADRVRWRI